MRNPRVLVFTKTAGYRHESIPDAITALRKIGPSTGILFHFTEYVRCLGSLWSAMCGVQCTESERAEMGPTSTRRTWRITIV